MRTAFIRRMIYLATVVLLLWAILITPGLVAPEWTAGVFAKIFPARVAKRLGRLIPPKTSPVGIDPAEITKTLQPPPKDPGETGVTMERFARIEYVITGEKPPVIGTPTPVGALSKYVKVLLTFAAPDATKSGGFAVLDLSNVKTPRQQAVAEGDVLDIEGTPATVKKVMRDTVVFEFMNREETMYRDGLPAEQQRELEETRRRASLEGGQSEAADPSADKLASEPAAQGPEQPSTATEKADASLPDGAQLPAGERTAFGVLDRLVRGAHVRPFIAELSLAGYTVASIEPGSFAQLHGLKQGDVLLALKVDGKAIPLAEDAALADLKLDAPIELEFRRGDEQQSILFPAAE